MVTIAIPAAIIHLLCLTIVDFSFLLNSNNETRPRYLSLPDLDSFSVADNHFIGHSQEQPVVDNACPPLQLPGQLRRIGDGTEVGVEDQVALIGLKWRTIATLA
jgi:hypothetical protein